MQRSNRPEMALVECEEPRCLEARGDYHDGEIGQPEVEVGIAPLELSDPCILTERERLDNEAPTTAQSKS